jgi:hypothetical protein
VAARILVVEDNRDVDGYIAKPIDPAPFACEIEAFLPDGLRSRRGPA